MGDKMTIGRIEQLTDGQKTDDHFVGIGKMVVNRSRFDPVTDDLRQSLANAVYGAMKSHIAAHGPELVDSRIGSLHRRLMGAVIATLNEAAVGSHGTQVLSDSEPVGTERSAAVIASKRDPLSSAPLGTVEERLTVEQAKERLCACPHCGGEGVIEVGEYVTTDMANDAGEPSMAGERMSSRQQCSACGGAGCIEDERVDALIAAVRSSADVEIARLVKERDLETDSRIEWQQRAMDAEEALESRLAEIEQERQHEEQKDFSAALGSLPSGAQRSDVAHPTTKEST